MKLCVFMGTFNPIHKTHLAMAREALGKYNKVLFIPAYKPPHKDYDPQMSRHRLEMVKLATACEPRFEVSDIEFKREKPSYTYDTITELYTTYPSPPTPLPQGERGEYIEGKIGFIIGSDAYEQIDDWYRAAELKELVDFIVFPRVDEVSSSAFRNGAGGIVTDEVECYIREHGLYKNN